MKHNLIIEIGPHFLPPARSPCLLVSDKDFSNFWIMASWQICCMRLNRMADARLPNINPLAAQPPEPPIALCGCLWCQITQHLLAQGTAGRQDVWALPTLSPPSLPTLSSKTLILFFPVICFLMLTLWSPDTTPPQIPSLSPIPNQSLVTNI